MSEIDRPDREWSDRTYPIREDMRLQRATWKAQRWGWAAMVAVMLLAAGGLFSTGPLSHTIASSADGRLSVEAERFLRVGAAGTWTLRLRAAAGQETALRIGPRFSDAFTIDSMNPLPLRATSAADGLTLVFHTGEAGLMLVVRLHARPKKAGLVPAQFFADGQSAGITHFVYP